MDKAIGFIGAGRITRIILQGLKNKGKLPAKISVSDSELNVLDSLKKSFKQIEISHNDNKNPARQDVVFISLHPPVLINALNEIKSSLKKDAVVISLAPKITIAKIRETIGSGFKIIRMIPNAPSIINAGFNPFVFSDGFTDAEKKEIKDLFSNLGECPEVKEEKLEAYAILTAMGPTYFWFQLYELSGLAKSFGLDDNDIKEGIKAMMNGTVKTMYESGLSNNEVFDLIPVKPIGNEEENIKNIYKTTLTGLFGKLKS
jgi:pyrroline-5-carboxylate reductase